MKSSVASRYKPRYKIARSVQVTADGQSFEMTIENCSEGGTLLTGKAGSLRDGGKLSLMIDGVRGAIASHALSVTKAVRISNSTMTR